MVMTDELKPGRIGPVFNILWHNRASGESSLQRAAGCVLCTRRVTAACHLSSCGHLTESVGLFVSVSSFCTACFTQRAGFDIRNVRECFVLRLFFRCRCPIV